MWFLEEVTSSSYGLDSSALITIIVALASAIGGAVLQIIVNKLLGAQIDKQFKSKKNLKDLDKQKEQEELITKISDEYLKPMSEESEKNKKEILKAINDSTEQSQKKYAEMRVSVDILTRANLSLVKYRLLRIYKSGISRRFRDTKSTETSEEMFHVYRELGGDSFMENLRDDFLKIQVVETPEKVSSSSKRKKKKS